MQNFQENSNPQVDKSSLYYVRQKELKHAKNGNPYLKLELVNKNERIFGNYWANAEKWYQKLHFQSLVSVSGEEKIFNDRKVLSIQSIDIIPSSENNATLIFSTLVPDQYHDFFTQQIKTISEPYSSILDAFFGQNKLTAFFTYPAGKLWAFHYEHGLIERTIQLFKLIDATELHSKELLKTAVILQSAGYMNGLICEHVIEYSSEARLLGIPQLALLQTNAFIEKSLLTQAEKLHLKHLILILPTVESDIQYVKPQTEEAIAFYNLQKMIYEQHGVKYLKTKEENKSRQWSAYNKLLGRFIFLPENQATSGNTNNN